MKHNSNITDTDTVNNSAGALWTKRETAAYVHKTIRTIDDWMARGRLPYYKVGRSVLFRPSDVQQHLDDNFRVRNRIGCLPTVKKST